VSYNQHFLKTGIENASKHFNHFLMEFYSFNLDSFIFLKYNYY